MLGYESRTRDIVQIFLEEEDIERLKRGKLTGEYIYPLANSDNYRRGLLEMIINNRKTGPDLIEGRLKRNDRGYSNWLLIEIREEEYGLFSANKPLEYKAGKRYVFIKDLRMLTEAERGIYEKLAS